LTSENWIIIDIFDVYRGQMEDYDTPMVTSLMKYEDGHIFTYPFARSNVSACYHCITGSNLCVLIGAILDDHDLRQTIKIVIGFRAAQW
jgi:hypothetical protein